MLETQKTSVSAGFGNCQYTYSVGELTDVLFTNIIDGKTTIPSADNVQFVWCFDFVGT